MEFIFCAWVKVSVAPNTNVLSGCDQNWNSVGCQYGASVGILIAMVEEADLLRQSRQPLIATLKAAASFDTTQVILLF